ncbi:sensor histidine kinase [Streptomyces sp. NPDC002491]
MLSWVVGLFGLAGLLYGAAPATRADQEGWHAAAVATTAGIGVGWSMWLVGRYTRRLVLSLAAVALLGVSGGAMTPLSAFGVVVVGLAALCAGTLVELLPAAVLALAGVAAAAVSATVAGDGLGELAATGIGALLGLLLGAGRRQQRVQERADAELAVERQRRRLEQERVELLAERNRLAREVHDVLAHTLSALSVQLTAVDSLMEDGVGAEEVRAAVARSRRLVVEGLQETRRAVRALRDEPMALDERLSALADGTGADFRIRGLARPLPPAVAMALWRLAQEALTNARKHAPGAPITMELAYGDTSVRLVIADSASGAEPDGELAATGGGYGLQGMRERVELLGGTFRAGPADGGWRVEAEVPA